MLLVFGVAVAGVLVEAFVPRPRRRAIHLALALGGLAAAFVITIVVGASSSLFAHGSPGHVAAEGAVGGRRADPVHLGHDPGPRVRQRPAHRRVVA